MTTKLTAHHDAYTDQFGDHPERNSEWEPEIQTGKCLNGLCYVITANWFGKYYIKETFVSGYYYNGMWGWELMNGWRYQGDLYGKEIFGHADRQKAIETCEKMNRLRKVKIKS